MVDRIERGQGEHDARLVAAYVARKQEIIASGITDSVEYAMAKGLFVQRALAER